MEKWEWQQRLLTRIPTGGIGKSCQNPGMTWREQLRERTCPFCASLRQTTEAVTDLLTACPAAASGKLFFCLTAATGVTFAGGRASKLLTTISGKTGAVFLLRTIQLSDWYSLVRFTSVSCIEVT